MVSTDVTGNTTETSKSSGGSLGSSVADSSVAMSSASSGVEMSSASDVEGD